MLKIESAVGQRNGLERSLGGRGQYICAGERDYEKADDDDDRIGRFGRIGVLGHQS